MSSSLIINADDFGLTAGINRAVLELHCAGVLTSASLMATGPAFEEAAEIARTTPTLGVGCHVVLVDGIPISHPQDIPTLLGADGKTFRPSAIDFAQAVLRGTVHAADVARETQAQIQTLQRAGIDVTHVDSHKHTHLFPAVAETVFHIAQRCGVFAVRSPFEPSWSVAASNVPWVRRMQLAILNRFEPAFRKLPQVSDASLQIPAGTVGIAATGTLDAATLRRLLAGLPDDSVYELCCHPGYNDADLDLQETRLRETRDIEREALLAVLPEFCAQPDAPELIHYGNLGVAGLQRASGQFLPNDGYERVL
jgi:hopanoid biosynthesis associated protein HpnK